MRHSIVNFITMRHYVILTRETDYAALCYNAANTVYFIPMRLGAALLDVALLVVMRHFTTPPKKLHHYGL
jgi:hypothetical protein